MDKLKSVSMRFLKVFLASAFASMVVVSIKQPTIWGEFIPLLNNLAMAGAYGGIAGSLLAYEKWASWTELPPTQ